MQPRLDSPESLDWIENPLLRVKSSSKELHDEEKTEMRSFDTGATRNQDVSRVDPEGFLSPLVIERFCEYMHVNRVQSDGSLRDSDNWQKGIPQDVYMKSAWRHFLHLWLRHRGMHVSDPHAAATIEDDICALLFNLQGYLHEILKSKSA
jgi:hypothetical protein